ncbi:hypothetical protein [Algicola sagamiensis]|uniref:hypothetical protein n=1 Tax=Algicola sagamiensis TaxID=163869 RepID=UPI00035C4B24|nr:hypothetical protein [Algicola sagamiensis]
MTNKMHAHDSIQLLELTTNETMVVNGGSVGGTGDGDTTLPPKNSSIIAHSSNNDIHGGQNERVT